MEAAQGLLHRRARASDTGEPIAHSFRSNNVGPVRSVLIVLEPAASAASLVDSHKSHRKGKRNMNMAERFWDLPHQDQEEVLHLAGRAIIAGAERSADTWWLLAELERVLASKGQAAPDAYAEAAW
jgi:hypothetical protein